VYQGRVAQGLSTDAQQTLQNENQCIGVLTFDHDLRIGHDLLFVPRGKQPVQILTSEFTRELQRFSHLNPSSKTASHEVEQKVGGT
jgi:hypothetical protein